jgi:ABC-type uncharacterized transport system auxiliary subunit
MEVSMGWDRRVWILCVVFCLLPGGCLNLKKPRQRVEFYTLEYEPVQVQDPAPLPAVIRVDPFTVAPMYNTNRMIYRDASFKRNAYAYHRWRANPGELVGYFLSRDLKESGLFKGALAPGSGAEASYRLEGSVDEFLEWNGADWEAVLSITLTLMAENEPDISKRILFQRSYGAREPCSQKNPQALAEAMSKALSRVSGEVMGDLYEHLKEHGQDR